MTARHLNFGRHLVLSVAVSSMAILGACKKAETISETVTENTPAPNVQQSENLAKILSEQSEAAKARFKYRNPQETLEFFGIEPGMTVAEALPGGGWYSKILLPYLGEDGGLVGMDYSLEMWPLFGGFANEVFMEKKKTWAADWVSKAKKWPGAEGPEISAFAFGSRDTALDGQVDAVLFIRALHNLQRFSDKGDYIGQALGDAHALLKPGGVLGIVQHRGPETNTDEWASGGAGYLKQSAVIAKIEASGFKFVGSSEHNANPADNPSNTDIVWRLPPSLGTSKEDEALKTKMLAIGESDRMTLKFVKP